jgi:outer membrane protein assembly factor BamA
LHYGFALAAFILTVIAASMAFAAVPLTPAVTIAALDPSRVYRVEAIGFSGNSHFSDSDLEAAMRTKARPFYALWQKRPRFEPETFIEDLDQLNLFYHAHGYYDAYIAYDLEIHGDLVTPHITIAEGSPVKVDKVSVELVKPGPEPQTLQPGFALPLKPGQIFTEANYQAGEQSLIAVYRENGYAHPDVNRHAVVRTGPHLAQAWYRLAPNAQGIFGRTIVTGTHKVNPRIILRELAYQAGQPFDFRKIDKSRAAILNINLFSAVEFTAGNDPHHPHAVPITIAVQEKAQHSLNLALGYNTETMFNARIGWNDSIFLATAASY